MIIKNGVTISSVLKGTTPIQVIKKGLRTIYEAFKKLTVSGKPPLRLLESAGKDLSDYRVYGQSVQGGLPSEYQQVEYIEGSGTQYFVIDYIASGITSTKGKFQITDVTKGSFLFGSRGTGGSNFYGLNWGGGSPYKYYNSYLNGVITSTQIDTEVHTFYKDKGKLYIDDTLISTTSNVTFTTPSKMNIFACYDKQDGYLPTYARIFSLQFYDETTLKVDLIPCYRKEDNIIGMYDLVSQTFYTNKGSETFLKGKDFITPETPIEIESVGDKTSNLCNAIEENSLVYRDDYKNYTIENGKVTTSGDTLMGFIVPVKPNTTFSFGFVLKRIAANYVSFRLRQYTQFPTTFAGSYNQPVSQQFTQNGLCSVNLTTSENINYVLLTIYTTGKLEAYDFMANEGSTLLNYEPYGKYKIPVKVSGKNLIPYPYQNTTMTINGVTFTDNGDGTITANGTAGANANATFYCYQWSNLYIPAGSYTFRGNPLEGNVVDGSRIGQSTIALRKNGNVIVNTGDYGNGQTFTKDETDQIYISIRINAGMTANNLVFKPQLELGNVSTDFEPYIEPITTNIYLNEPLRKVGDFADYIDYKNNKIVRNTKSIVLNGSVKTSLNNWRKAEGYYAVGYALSKFPDRYKTNDMGYILCKQLPNRSYTNLYSTGNPVQGISNNNTASYSFFIRLKTNEITTEAQYYEYLNNNPLDIVYVMSEPIEETIELPSIATSKGTNIVDIETIIKPSKLQIEYFGLA